MYEKYELVMKFFYSSF